MTGSRSTYRRPASEVAWQRQLRDRYLAEGAPSVDLSLKKATVREVSRGVAQAIILRYEWLGTLGNSSVFYGLMFGEVCGGVCCVALSGSGTAGPTTGAKFRLPQRDVAILARGACVHWAPPGANSKLVAWTCRLLGKSGRARLLMAYSDSDAGEVGTIYQACGWTYIGRTKRPGDAEYVSPNGRVINSQSVGAWARKNGVRYSTYAKQLLARGWRTQKSNPKGVYVNVLDKGDALLVARVAAMAKPYPKRVGSIDSDAAGFQPAEGGASPTPTLHTQGGA